MDNPKKKKGKGESTLGEQELHERIAEKAYELYQKRGQIHGHDLEDWLTAERMVYDEVSRKGSTKAETPRARVRRQKKQ